MKQFWEAGYTYLFCSIVVGVLTIFEIKQGNRDCIGYAIFGAVEFVIYQYKSDRYWMITSLKEETQERKEL